MCVVCFSIKWPEHFPEDELKKYENTHTGIQVSQTLLSFHFNQKWYSYSYITSQKCILKCHTVTLLSTQS